MNAMNSMNATNSMNAMLFQGLIFPKDLYCISCGRPLPLQENSGAALCQSCADEIEWANGRLCGICGRPLSDENPREICRDCERSGGFAFEKAYACAVYSGRAAEIVREMKYRNKAWYADTLSSFMASKYFSEADNETGELPAFDFLVPVPMGAAKMAKRGYNQAELVARGLSRRTGIPFLKKALLRVRETDVMSALSESERKTNLEGAFSVPYDIMKTIAGKKILLADDVYTTGSSANACAEALLDAGAKSVSVIVFATGADVRRMEGCPAVVESPGQLRAKGPT